MFKTGQEGKSQYRSKIGETSEMGTPISGVQWDIFICVSCGAGFLAKLLSLWNTE
jgi:hypothetical protein